MSGNNAQKNILVKLAIICSVIFVLVYVFPQQSSWIVWRTLHSSSIATTINNTDPQLLFSIGNYYFGEGAYDTKKAEAYFRGAITLDPTLQGVHYQLARVYFVRGYFNSALAEINKEIELYPDFGRSHYVRGLIYGYTGQFIPSTWVCYGGFINTQTNTCTPPSGATSSFWQGPWQYVASKDRVRKLLGANEPSNPWNPKVAIMATAMLMADNGASLQTPKAERLAALRYFAGWSGASNPAYSFYGDGVMGFAARFQKDITQLGGI